MTRGWLEAEYPDQVLQGGQHNVPRGAQEVTVTMADAESIDQ